MSAIDSIKTYSDAALSGAIRQLEFGNQWANRLHVLIREKQRRQIIRRKNTQAK